jgi:hypothetical protein
VVGTVIPEAKDDPNRVCVIRKSSGFASDFPLINSNKSGFLLLFDRSKVLPDQTKQK